MIPPRYFPFTTPEFSLSVGARPFSPEDRRIEITAEYASEVDEKARLLAADAHYYFQELPGTREAQREAVALLEQDTRGRLPRSPRAGDLAPLDAFGRCVQEDLLLLDDKLRLVVGQLCFANAWCIGEKLGLPLMAVHAPVPGYAEQLAAPVEKLLTRLKPERPVWRVNWGLRPTPQLDQTSRHRLWVERMKQGCTLDDCWLRVERQTLSMLGRTGHVLFTIHTYQERVSGLAPRQRDLVAGAVSAAPIETLRYKGLAFLKDEAEA